MTETVQEVEDALHFWKDQDSFRYFFATGLEFLQNIWIVLEFVCSSVLPTLTDCDGSTHSGSVYAMFQVKTLVLAVRTTRVQRLWCWKTEQYNNGLQSVKI